VGGTNGLVDGVTIQGREDAKSVLGNSSHFVGKVKVRK